MQTAKSLITANRSDSRLDTLYAYCRMFQNLFVGAVALLAFFAVRGNSLWYWMPPAIFLSWLGMRTYAKHYAREFFASVRAWHAHPRAGFGLGSDKRLNVVEFQEEEAFDEPSAIPFDVSLLEPRRRASDQLRRIAA